MLRPRHCAAPILLLLCTACGSSHSVDEPNPAIAHQVNEAASNISSADGRAEMSPPMTPAEAGATMRTSATTRPPQQP
ncbi:hypothetical protein Q4F19_01015 [Sphingomonas sp. BIUV-7]|uniref:Lipoprotein n=1 Tax=Sphingomonas natans TaxID=3063330 RepID=A0ABT8Y3S0_9SPHN|nr:hypothetical protein [Sphingomonas sp. BIUV-7]MDO6412953.1 hypothetical protein [Sphingomonas sp. BIUV-7]